MSLMRGASRQPDSLTRLRISSGAPQAQHASADFSFCAWHHSQVMRASGSAAAGAFATRGASFFTGVLCCTGGGAAAAGAWLSNTNIVPSIPQNVSCSPNRRLQVGQILIAVLRILSFCASAKICSHCLPVDWLLRNSQSFRYALIHILTLISNARWTNHIIVHVNAQLAVLDQQIKERGDVARVKLTGMHRHGSGQIQRRDNQHAVDLNRLVRFAESAIAAGGAGQIDNY